MQHEGNECIIACKPCVIMTFILLEVHLFIFLSVYWWIKNKTLGWLADQSRTYCITPSSLLTCFSFLSRRITLLTDWKISSVNYSLHPTSCQTNLSWLLLLACKQFYPHLLFRFVSYLLLLFHPSLTPLSSQLSSQSHILISTHITFTSSR